MADALVKLRICPAVPPSGGSAEGLPVLVSVQPPEGSVRTPSHICCLIDISWSMSMEAKVQEASGVVESNGLSMLDVAKHAVRTIIATLGPQDRLSIVEFARVTQTVFPPAEMTTAGKILAGEALDGIGFGSGTDLWNGLKEALTCLSKTPKGLMSHIMLLTDGETENKDTIVPNLEEWIKSNGGGIPGTICCFGFGYEINSKMLSDIADLCDGTYAFIPDAGFVGTCFVNSVSNLLVTMASGAMLTLKAPDGVEIAEVLGGWEAKRQGSSVTISLGSLQFGQSKDIVLSVNVKSSAEPVLTAQLTYGTLHGAEFTDGAAKFDEELAPSVEPNRCRALVVDALRKAVSVEMSVGQQLVKDVAAVVLASPAAQDEKVSALLEDVLGQCTEALSKTEYYDRWGRHYIPSVASAHKVQQCYNFKDPGVQLYGSKLFEELRDAADQAFDTMPAPKVTPAEYRYLGGNKVIRNPDYVQPGSAAGARPGSAAGARLAPAPAPAVRMAAYNDRYGGCIHGDCRAMLAQGGSRRLAELRKGDIVVAGEGEGGAFATAEVVCMVRSGCPGGRVQLTTLEGADDERRPLRLTPYHPVQVNGEWRFPADLGMSEEVECPAVFSFVLRGAPALLVEAVPCIALGHGLAEGAAAHPYFASERVVEDLEAMPGYSSGVVDLLPEDFVREPVSGTVCGIRRAEA